MNDIQILPPGDVSICREASNDVELLKLWLATFRSPHTRRGYQADARALFSFAGLPLREIRMVDLQAFAAGLDGTPSSQARRISGIKSLFKFSLRLGYLRFDVAAPLPLPAIKDQLGERIVSEEQMLMLLASVRRPRDAVMMRLLYSSGLRIAELCSLRWRDLVPRDAGGQFAVLGKGGKTRTIIVPASLWSRLVVLRGAAVGDAALFSSRNGGGLQPRRVHEIIKRAGRRVGMPPEFSAHWFRHAHASHALDRGAPVSVVQATLGHSSLATTSRYTHVRPGDSSSKYLAA